jgi:hypothetical protein
MGLVQRESEVEEFIEHGPWQNLYEEWARQR